MNWRSVFVIGLLVHAAASFAAGEEEQEGP